MATLTERNIVLVSKDANGNTCLDYPLTRAEQVEDLESYVKNHSTQLKLPLSITGGGTGLTSSPSMLTDLGSTSAANVLQASPRPGVTGILSVAKGGTGANTVAAAVQALLGSAAVGSSTKSIYYDGKTLKACADSIGGGGIVAQLLKQNGYAKFANGLILQWGMFNTEWKGSNIVKFNISFAQICLTMFSTSITSDGYNNYGKIVSVSTTQFTHEHGGNAHPYYYFAIGY